MWGVWRERTEEGPHLDHHRLSFIRFIPLCKYVFKSIWVWKYFFLSLWQFPCEKILSSYNLFENCPAGFQEDIWMEKTNRRSPKLPNVVNLWYAYIFEKVFLNTLAKATSKKTTFYGQADSKRTKGVGGRSALSALTVSKCENFGPIFLIIKW